MNKLYAKVYGWLFIGLLLTFATGAFFSNYEDAMVNIMGGSGYLIMILIELGISIFLSTRIHKMSNSTATFCYLLYSFVTGITFSTIFMTYEIKSVILIFLVTAVIFGLFALIAMFTNLPLDKLGTTLFMMLLGIIIASLINAFIVSNTLDLIICIICVLVFVGYVGYDTKNLPILFDTFGEEKGAIFGAFQLYLDFINIFIKILQLFGDRDKN